MTRRFHGMRTAAAVGIILLAGCSGFVPSATPRPASATPSLTPTDGSGWYTRRGTEYYYNAEGGFIMPKYEEKDGVRYIYDPTLNEYGLPTETPHPPASTWTPSPTETPGPRPDLEIVDWKTDADGAFYGFMRNNSPDPIALPARVPIFRLFFDSWWADTGEHFKIGPVDVDTGLAEKSFCILYPGETGIFRSRAECEGSIDCELEKEDLHPGDVIEEGHFLTGWNLTGNHVRIPEMPREFHPEAENPKFQIESDRISFSFDVFQDYRKMYKRTLYDEFGWFLFYDIDHLFITAMRQDLFGKVPFTSDLVTQRYFYSGYFLFPGLKAREQCLASSDCWDLMPEWLGEDLDRIAQVEVLVEIQDDNLCSIGDVDYFRKTIPGS